MKKVKLEYKLIKKKGSEIRSLNFFENNEYVIFSLQELIALSALQKRVLLSDQFCGVRY